MSSDKYKITFGQFYTQTRRDASQTPVARFPSADLHCSRLYFVLSLKPSYSKFSMVRNSNMKHLSICFDSYYPSKLPAPKGLRLPSGENFYVVGQYKIYIITRSRVTVSWFQFDYTSKCFRIKCGLRWHSSSERFNRQCYRPLC